MAARVDIVVGAINRTKAVFQEVGMQADNLNKRMQKVAGIFRGLFVAGVAAQFGRSLLEASSYAKELEQSASNTKNAWRGVSTDLGDAFARIVMSVTPVIQKVGSFFDAMVGKLQFGGAFITSMLSGAGFEESKRIAQETVAEIEREQKARLEADSVLQAEMDALQHKNELIAETVKLERELATEQERSAEAQMSASELLAKRKKQLEDLKSGGVQKLFIPGMDQESLDELNRQAELKTKIKIVNLEQEIDRLERQAAGALDKADEESSKKKVIRFNRESRVGLGRGMLDGFDREGTMARRSAERMAKLNATDPSWKSANYLHDIRDKIDKVLALGE